MRPGSRSRGAHARRRGVASAAAVVVALLLAGCSDAISPPGASDVVVDSPQARAIKAEAGIVDCAPGGGGGGLPDLTLPCLGGGTDVDLASLTGPLVVNLWASNCGPCRREMPVLQDFYEQYGDSVGVLGIDMENYPEAALAFARDTGATYPQLADPGGELVSQDDVRIGIGLPQTILLDAGGDVVHQRAGELADVAEIVALLAEHAGVDL